MKKISIYGLVSLVSLILRQNVLPTPAEALGFSLFGIADVLALLDGAISIAYIFQCLPGFFINYLAETPIYIVTFFVVGLYYTSGDCPAFGSFLYFIFYCIHILLLSLICWVDFNAWLTVLIILLYAAAHIFVKIKIDFYII